MEKPLRQRIGLVLGALLFAGCPLAPVVPAVFRCPDGRCPPGLVCDAEARCVAPSVPGGGLSDGGLDAGSDGGAVCPAGLHACPGSAVCVNWEIDPGNCGGCDHVCAPGQLCVNGGCALTCSGADGGGCGAYGCNGTTACWESCGSDAQCAPGNYCSPVIGQCFPFIGPGQGCTSDTECGSGECLGGICCAGACVTDGGCGASACFAGDGGCEYPASECGAGSCAGGVETLATYCAAGGCPGPKTASCGGYACGASTCKTSCATSADCAFCHDCGDGGQCSDMWTDPGNCGGCGHACPSGEACVGGACGCDIGGIGYADGGMEAGNVCGYCNVAANGTGWTAALANGVACGDGGWICEGGSCSPYCPAGESPTFGTAVTYGVGSGPMSVAIGDLNGDGEADLAVANWGGGNGDTVSVLLNEGSGTFGTAVTYGVGSGPASVAIGDLNGDGKADLAVANGGSATVSVLLNEGSGRFGTAVTYGVGSGPNSVAIGDLNGDGKADLAVANSGDNTVSVLLNEGSGRFGTAVTYGVGSGPFSVAIGDLNGDGKADLAVANFGGTTVSVLLNEGSGVFGTAVTYGVGINPNSVAIGDLNGDGKADLAVANYGGGSGTTVSVLLNECQ